MAYFRPTLKEVASLSGYSEISVSRVMRNAPNVSSTLRDKVEAAARELNYVPNKVAGALAANTSDLMGVVLPTLQHREYNQILAGIESVFSNTKYSILLASSEYSTARETASVRNFLSWNPSGIILVGDEHSSDTYQLLEKSASVLVEIFNEEKHPASLGLNFSYQQAISDLVRNWAAKGCQQAVYIGTADAQLGHHIFKKRLREELNHCGIQLRCEVMNTEESSSAAQEISFCQRIIKQKPETDAVFLSSIGFTEKASSYNTDNLPTHIALAGFDHSSEDNDHSQRIDLINLPFKAIGSTAANLLLHEGNADAQAQLKSTILPATFHQRGLVEENTSH